MRNEFINLKSIVHSLWTKDRSHVWSGNYKIIFDVLADFGQIEHVSKKNDDFCDEKDWLIVAASIIITPVTVKHIDQGENY